MQKNIFRKYVVLIIVTILTAANLPAIINGENQAIDVLKKDDLEIDTSDFSIFVERSNFNFDDGYQDNKESQALFDRDKRTVDDWINQKEGIEEFDSRSNIDYVKQDFLENRDFWENKNHREIESQHGFLIDSSTISNINGIDNFFSSNSANLVKDSNRNSFEYEGSQNSLKYYYDEYFYSDLRQNDDAYWKLKDTQNMKDDNQFFFLPSNDNITIDSPSFLSRNKEYIPGEILVKFRGELGRNLSISSSGIVHTGVNSIDKLNERYEIIEFEEVFRRMNNRKDPAYFNVYKLKISKEKDISQALTEFRDNPAVIYAEPNYIFHTCLIPNDPGFDYQWALHQSSDHDIDAPEAWDIETGSTDVVIAIIDTGVDYTHPDLTSNIWINAQEVIDGYDNDGNGYIDDIKGWDFCNDDNDPIDDFGHGTHCSGIAAAVTNNNVGIAGVSWNSGIMSVKGLNSGGSGSSYDLANAIYYAADNGADVISMSWGSSWYSETLKDALDYAYNNEVALVGAAGNYDSNLKFYPAAYDTVIAISATDSSDNKAYFSNYGSWVDVAAPGVSIYSTMPTYFVTMNDMGYDQDYDHMSGTSMACPHVAGLAGLILSKNSDFTSLEILTILHSSTDNLYSDEYFGIGRINAYEAIQRDSIPIANLDSSLDDKIVRGAISINGTASGDTFLAYTIYYGEGIYPNAWTYLDSSSSSVIEDVLATLDTTLIGEGVHSIRLLVYDIYGETCEDRVVFTVDNNYILQPLNNDIYRLGDVIEIEGTVNGSTFQSYTIEWGIGQDPTEWFTSGITLINDGLVEIKDGTLALWDTSFIIEENFITLRLIAYHTGLQKLEFVRNIYLDPTLKEGWPQRINYEYVEDSIWGHSYYWAGYLEPVISDIDNDGEMEIIVYIGGSPNKIYVFNQNGGIVEGWPVEVDDEDLPGGNLGSPSVADINNDGHKEIFVNGREGIYVYNHDGSFLRLITLKLSSQPTIDTTLSDLNNDGELEIIRKYDPIYEEPYLGQKVAVLDQYGNMLDNWPQLYYNLIGPDGYYQCSASIESTPAVGNFDDDPEKEIVVAGVRNVFDDPANPHETWHGEGRIFIYNLDGTILPGFPADIDGKIFSSPSIGDINNDGYDEIIVATMKSDNPNSGLYIIDRFGNSITGWPQLVGESIWTSPAIADFNNDGFLEIVASTLGSPFSTYIFNYEGNILPGWPQYTSWNDYRSPVVADVNGDGIPDILTTAGNGCIYSYGGVYAWNFDGTTIEGFPKVTEVDAQASATIADIDNDGMVELIASSDWDKDLENGQYKSRGSLYVWELESNHNPSTMHWPTFHHDNQRTGEYNSPPICVDDDFNLSTPGWGIDHFDSIQDGVDAAEVGGTIYVYNGTYYENVVIDKSINFIGENRETVIIDGQLTGDVLIVSADFVKFSGFTIKNSGNNVNDAGIEIHSNYNIINGNKLINSFFGIFLWDSNFNYVSYNILNITNSNGCGIFLFASSDNNTISDNFIICNGTGVSFLASSYNLIEKNHIANGDVEGISLSESSNNIILENSILKNRWGIYLWNSMNNQIVQNNIVNNTEVGIRINSSSNNNQIFRNILANNFQNAYDEANNSWDNNYPSGGNYWDDYSGIDNFYGPNQDIYGSDGIGDTPHLFLWGEDNYPFMTPEGCFNVPPDIPNNPTPENDSIEVGIDTNISWIGSDSNSNDTILFDVYFGTDQNPPMVSNNQSLSCYSPGNLDHSTTYYWRIVAWDNYGLNTIGPLWHFTTEPIPPPPENSVVFGFINNIITGDPIEDAWISLDWRDDLGHYDWNYTHSDYNGFYRMNIAAGEFDLYISADGYFSESTGYYNFDIGENETIWVNISLKPYPPENSIVCGYVTDISTGDPIGGASVDLYVEIPGNGGPGGDGDGDGDGDGGSSSYTYWNHTTTDSIGYYQMNTAAGEIRISVYCSGYYSETTNWYQIDENETLWINVSLYSLLTENSIVCGFVNDSIIGIPIEDAWISLDWRDDLGHYDWNYTHSDYNGFYRMNIAAGEFDLYISADGYFSESTGYYNFDIGENETMWVNISLKPYPPENSIVCGYVTDISTGDPIGGASVDLYVEIPGNGGPGGDGDGDGGSSSYTYWNHTTTDSIGYYQMNTTAGEIHLYVNADDYYSESSEGYQIEEYETLWINVSMDPYPLENSIICGFVNDSTTGNTIENVHVSLFWQDGLGHFDWNDTYTDTSGFYTMNVAPGTIQLTFSADGYFGSSFNIYSIEDNETLLVNISLDPYPVENSIIYGYITDISTGDPIENSDVRLRWRDEQGHYYYNYTNSDALGFYTINAAAGEIRLDADADGYFRQYTEYFNIGEHEIIWINISLCPYPDENSIVCGYVTDSITGDPINNAYIDIEWYDDYGHYDWNGTYTDSSGFYSLNVAEGEVHLYCSAYDYFGGYQYWFEVREFETLWINISLTPRPPKNSVVCGYITNITNGDPIENAWIQLLWEDDQGHTDGGFDDSDASGFYSLNTAAGEIYLIVFASNYCYGDILTDIDENVTLWLNFSLEKDFVSPVFSNLIIPDYVGLDHPSDISVDISDNNLDNAQINLIDSNKNTFEESIIIWWYWDHKGLNDTYLISNYSGIYYKIEQENKSNPTTLFMLTNYTVENKIYTPAYFVQNQTAESVPVFLEFNSSNGYLENIAIFSVLGFGKIKLEYIKHMIEPGISNIYSLYITESGGGIIQNNYTLYSIGDIDNPSLKKNPLDNGIYQGSVYATDKAFNTNSTMFNLTVNHNLTSITNMGIIPSSNTVNIGEEFNVTVYIDPVEPIGGWQIYEFNFTQGKVNATEITAGPYWTYFFDEGTVDNDMGMITDIQTWTTDTYPDTNHTACVINFTALQPGVCTFEIAHVDISNNNFESIPVATYSAMITVIDNMPPILYNEYPENESTNIERPPNRLSVIVEDPNNDSMNVYIRIENHNNEWINLVNYSEVSNGEYSFIPPLENDWIWGNTTYVWSVNVSDGITWTNKTYCYTTGGSRYDVNNNDLVNFQDAGLVWIHRTSEVPYDGIYDVNQDGQVNFQDAGLTWINRD